MTVRTTYPGTEESGDVLTAANFDKLPGGWLGFVGPNSYNVLAGSTPVDCSGGLTVTVKSGRLLKLTGCVDIASPASNCAISFYEGSTQLHATAAANCPTAGTYEATTWYETTADGDLTFTAKVVHGSAVCLMFMIEDVGPVPEA